MSHKNNPYKNVTREYKISLANNEPRTKVEISSGPTQDPKLWQPQPKKVCIGKRKGVKIMQYVTPFTQ